MVRIKDYTSCRCGVLMGLKLFVQLFAPQVLLGTSENDDDELLI